jgi:ribulose-phosphate 3-epimerase
MKYLCDPHIIPTVVPRSLAEIESYARSVAEYADTLHVDVGDGRFQPTVTWPFLNPGQLEELDAFTERTQLPLGLSLDAHIMAEDARSLGERLARAGFHRIAVHLEAFQQPDEARFALDALRVAGCAEAGLALKIETPLTAIEGLVGGCDFVHLMSIAIIGSQGYAFDERALSRVEELHAAHPDLLVAVDGGVTEATVEELVRAGANRLMVGHVLAESAEPAAAYARIHERAMKGCTPAMVAGEFV